MDVHTLIHSTDETLVASEWDVTAYNNVRANKIIPINPSCDL